MNPGGSQLIDLILFLTIGAVVAGLGFAVWYYLIGPLVRSLRRRR